MSPLSHVSSISVASMVAAFVFSASSVAGDVPPLSATDVTTHTYQIKRANNYFLEQCYRYPAHARVSYEFTSPHAVDFNIHYHAKKDGLQLISDLKLVSHSKGEFTSDGLQPYCFMWTNREQRTAPFTLELIVSTDT